MRIYFFILLLFTAYLSRAQQSAAFTRISTDDGMGLNSNVIYSLQQDERGFMWVGNGNGLQRFDGSKFVTFSTSAAQGDELPDAPLTQIMAIENGKLLLVFGTIRQFGLFDPFSFIYTKTPLKFQRAIPARAQFYMWKTAEGEVYLNVLRYGMLLYDKKARAFNETNLFNIPHGWYPALAGIFEDEVQNQIWFACDSGLVVYNKSNGQTWHKYNNPAKLPLLENKLLQDRPTQFYIDKERRHWIFTWPEKGGGQVKYCVNAAAQLLPKDTAGLESRPPGYTEYNHFFETRSGGLWIYGFNVLFNWDRNQRQFVFNKSTVLSNNFSIDYESVHQLMEDKDGSLWIATDRGLYFSPNNDRAGNAVNLIFGNSKKNNGPIKDIVEMPSGDLWFASWGEGVRVVDKFFRLKKHNVYKDPPPASWNEQMKGSSKLAWALYPKRKSSKVFIGCNLGILVIFDTLNQKTSYLAPPEMGGSTIRFITEDAAGRIWIGTQSGRLVKYSNGTFNIVQDIGSIIYKIFIDRQGWMWLATHEKGLYAIDPGTGNILQHYTSDENQQGLYSNTGFDIEQLDNDLIVYGAGCLNFIDKNKKTVRQVGYKEGLPSNSVFRLRVDKKGFLWIITSNGLCRFNPQNNRITPYGRKDGIILGEQTVAADYVCRNGDVIFAGGNAVVMFPPTLFTTNQRPPDVTITDFKIFNSYIPIDSLQALPFVKLKHDQNSLSIYFSSLSYMQRDKLTYYYKLEGRDEHWIKANKWDYENYSLLPPGKYTFKVYCENIEGLRSRNITELSIYIKPPFWRSLWFISSLLFLLAMLIYYFHNERVKRLLAVEKIRNKVARDLHDDMGSTLSTINILTSMAKTKLATDPVRTTDYLGKISDNSERMMEAMDDIVWSIKPSNDSMQKITARMREFATNVLEAKEIELEFAVQEEVYDVKLDMEARRDFFLVFKEAVNNAAKYSRASIVRIRIEMKARKLQFQIEDNGVGFDVPNADAGNGMGNMKKRAEAMQGQLSIVSEQGRGTTVVLKIPV
jgi:signal transduction histidine kinase/ligand-binding sensor domain-containing protein